jgi:hypothetical protein
MLSAVLLKKVMFEDKHQEAIYICKKISDVHP